jgi:hypothetical protein
MNSELKAIGNTGGKMTARETHETAQPENEFTRIIKFLREKYPNHFMVPGADCAEFDIRGFEVKAIAAYCNFKMSGIAQRSAEKIVEHLKTIADWEAISVEDVHTCRIEEIIKKAGEPE